MTMTTTKEVRGRRVVITDDKLEAELERAAGHIVYTSSEVTAAKGHASFKLFSEWLFEAKSILPATQLIAVRPLNQ